MRENIDVGVLRYARELTKDEVEVGFDVLEHKSGEPVIVLRLDGGLRAVKVRLDDGAIAYVVCDDKLHELYPPAVSLDDLRSRFRVR
jgi:hypothetical protein